MKNTRWNKFVALFLLTVILLLPSCGGGNVEDAETTASPTGTTAPIPETTTPVDLGPSLAFKQEDNKGAVFTMLIAEHLAYEFEAEEETAEVVNDNVYKRNLEVERYLGIDFDYVKQKGGWDQKDDFNAIIRNDYMAGDKSYDLVSGICIIPIALASEGVLANVLDLEYVNMENDWWVSSLIDDIAIDGKLYVAFGDANLSMYKNYNAIFFNKDIIAESKMEDPYALVKSGKWTLDKFVEMATSVSADLNGDSLYTIDQDKFGYYTQNVPQRSWQTACDVNIFTRNSEGDFELLPLSEKFIDVADKVKYLRTDVSGKEEPYSINFMEMPKALAENRLLFMQNYLYAAESEHLRNMTSDYGIVPYPKYDEKQANYRSQIATSSAAFFVPTMMKNEALTGKVMEALAFFSTDTVVPAFYETAMKGKYARDPEYGEMIDLIRDTASMSFDFMYSAMFNPMPNSLFQSNISDPLASFYAKHERAWRSGLEDLMKAYAD